MRAFARSLCVLGLTGPLLVAAISPAHAEAIPPPCAVTISSGADLHCEAAGYEVGAGAGAGVGGGRVVPAAGAGVCYDANGTECINPQSYAVLQAAPPVVLVVAGACFYQSGACDYTYAGASGGGAVVGVQSGSYGISEEVTVP